jgi:hypothetical protein
MARRFNCAVQVTGKWHNRIRWAAGGAVAGAGRESQPILLFNYLNPLLAYGVEQFVVDAKSVGACFIIPDLPPEALFRRL